MTTGQKPFDDLLEKLEERFVNSPEATAQLKVLERHYYGIERLKKQLANAQAAMKDELAKMTNILDLLQVTRYELPNGFFCEERTYRDIEVVDPSKFMAWLKANCSPNEIMALLTPPTRMLDVKKFIEKKFDENQATFDFSIDGVVTKSTFTVLKTGVKSHVQKGPFRKEFDENPDTYKQKRAGNFRREGARQRPGKRPECLS